MAGGPSRPKAQVAHLADRLDYFCEIFNCIVPNLLKIIAEVFYSHKNNTHTHLFAWNLREAAEAGGRWGLQYRNHSCKPILETSPWLHALLNIPHKTIKSYHTNCSGAYSTKLWDSQTRRLKQLLRFAKQTTRVVSSRSSGRRTHTAPDVWANPSFVFSPCCFRWAEQTFCESPFRPCSCRKLLLKNIHWPGS